jgi:hypothetical protein
VQISQCKIYAKNSGVVVYYVPEQTRGGFGSNQSIIAQGEPVNYNQKMMSIPDTAHMLVNVRIHEAFINQMKVGLPVRVRVDAVSNRELVGKVKMVGLAAAQQDWMSPDVKVYACTVEITGIAGLEEKHPELTSEALEKKQEEEMARLKLKPGLSAVCTIFTEKQARKVMAVPIQAILSPLEKGGKPRCYVQTAKGVEPYNVELGMTDDKYVQIKSGESVENGTPLQVGDEVVLNPRTLLTDKSRKKSGDDDRIVPVGGGPGRPGGAPKDRGGKSLGGK